MLLGLFASCLAVHHGDSGDSDQGGDSTPDIVDSADPVDSADTADRTDTAATGLTPVTAPSCLLEEDPHLGWLITCTSTWTDADAERLDGGTLVYNLLDATGASLAADTTRISSVADGNAGALLFDDTLWFGLVTGVGTQAYTVNFGVISADGTATSAEFACAVSPAG